MSSWPPPLKSLLWRDFLASALARVGIGVWGFVILFELIGRFGGEQAAMIHAFGAGNLLAIAAVASAVALPLLWWRLSVLQRVLSDGRPIPAKVVSTENQQTMRAVWVEYELDGEILRRRNAVRHSGRRPLEIGQEVTLIIAPNANHIGFVRELYED